MKHPKKLALLAVFSIIMSVIGLASPAQALTEGCTALSNRVVRCAGPTRDGTAVAVGNQYWPGTQMVVVASGRDFADALSCGAYAGRFRTPLLLTGTNGLLSSDTQAYIRRLAPDTATWVALCGGPAAVSPTVEQQIRSLGYGNIVRHQGVDRYETSVRVAEQSTRLDVIVLADGNTYQDALTGSYIAGKDNGVLLLTDGPNMPSSVANYIRRYPNVRRMAVGYNAGYADPASTTEKYTSSDPYMTMRSAAQRWCDKCQTIFVVSGENWPDALSVVPRAIAANGSILYTTRAVLAPVARDYIRERRSIANLGVQIVGGTAAVSEATAGSVVEAMAN